MAFHRFLDFPLELRELVYREILLDNPIKYRPKPHSRSVYRTVTEFRNGQVHRVSSITIRKAAIESPTEYLAQPPPSKYPIMYANRQVSDEFIHWTHLDATFDFLISEPNTTDWVSWEVNSNTLKRVRHIQFTHDYNSAKYWADDGHGIEIYFPKLVAACPRLRWTAVNVILDKKWLKDREDEYKGNSSQYWTVTRKDWTGSWLI